MHFSNHSWLWFPIFSKFRIKRMQPFFLLFKCIWGLFLESDIVIEESGKRYRPRMRVDWLAGTGEKSWIFYAFRLSNRSNCQTSRNNSEKFVNLPRVRNVYTARKYRPIRLRYWIVCYFRLIHCGSSNCSVTPWSWNFHSESLRYVMTINTARYSARNFQ